MANRTNLNFSGIYKIINKTNGKFYIGSAVNLRKRKNKHFEDLCLNKHHSPYLQYSYNKYGKNSFEFEVLELVQDKEKLTTVEQVYLDSLKPVYNWCKVAGSTLGFKRSKASCKAQSERMKGYKHSEETKRKIALANTGKEFSKERKQAIKDGKLKAKLVNKI